VREIFERIPSSGFQPSFLSEGRTNRIPELVEESEFFQKIFGKSSLK
jgi:hypothetical protein